MLSWMTHKLESILPREISVTSDMQMIPSLLAECKEELKSLLMKVKESEKVGVKLNIQKMKTMASGAIISWQIDREKWKTVTDLIFLGSKITASGDYSHGMKSWFLPERKAMTNLNSILKNSNRVFLTKVHILKAMVFPVFMYGYESWTIKKAEH